MGKLVVKHFRRAAAGNGKELVMEVVSERSDTARFLKRMDHSRLARPCFQTIDMRGQVAGECRPHAFNDRIHYLDDISFQMFEQGLLDNRGVYTEGTCESIISGGHTLEAQHEAREQAEQKRSEIEQRRLEHARTAEEGAVTATINPALVPLGYFRKRAHPRLLYSCAVTLQRGNIKSVGITRDISVCGVQVRVKGLSAFRAGDEIRITFDGLEQDAGCVRLKRLAYTLLRSDMHDNGTSLHLRRVNAEKTGAFSALVEDLVERCAGKHKLDVEDEYLTALSWYYERCYAQSVGCIPFFVEKNEQAELRVRAVAMSEGNAWLARFFCTDADNYDFSPLCLPGRLQQLVQNRSFMLAMYRHQGPTDSCLRIYSAADFELAGPDEFAAFVQHAAQHSEYSIVKVLAGASPLVDVPENKLVEVSQRLQHKSGQQMTSLREQLKRLLFTGLVVDMTREFTAVRTASQPGELFAWVGAERRSVAQEVVQETLSLSADSLCPELVRFGYVERRREDRYLAETRVEVVIDGQMFEGMSRDISTLGLCVQLLQRVELAKGTGVRVGLVSLQRKKASTNLMNIPYRVVNSHHREPGTVLMLERVLGGSNEGLKEFFVELISKNRHKLGVDTGDIRGAVESRVYESLLAANTPGIPFFLGYSIEGGAHLQFVGETEAGNSLQEFFTSTDGQPDYRCLNEPRIVTALYDAIQMLARQERGSCQGLSPFAIELYLYKEYDELSGEIFIHAATELDFSSDETREIFLGKLDNYPDWRCVKIVSSFIRTPDEKIRDQLLEMVREQSKHRAIRLSDVMHALAGYGELIDITDEWMTLR